MLRFSRTGLMVPSTFETWATATTRVRGPRSRRKASMSRCPSGVMGTALITAPESRAASLPRDDVGVVLHLGDDDLVAGLERMGEGVRHQAQAVGGPAREDDLLAMTRADELLHAVARQLVQLGRLLAERVDRPMDVGVAALVVAHHGLDDLPRLLAGGRGVEVDHAVAIDHPVEDGKVGPGQLVESHRALPRAVAEHAHGKRHAAHAGRANVGLEHGQDVCRVHRLRLGDRPPPDQLGHDVGRGQADGAGVPDEASLGDRAILHADGHSHTIAAQRVHVLGHSGGVGQLAAKARAAPALADHVAVENRRRCHSSSPRTTPARYGGKR